MAGMRLSSCCVVLWIRVHSQRGFLSLGTETESRLFEPVHEKTNNLGFRPGPTQTRLYSHRRWLEAGNFGFRKYRNCTIRVSKTKAKLICAFVFAYADCWFSHAAAHLVTD